MLSAVAARKAAQAATQDYVPVATSSHALDTKPTSKRKSNLPSATTPKKKRRNDKTGRPQLISLAPEVNQTSLDLTPNAAFLELPPASAWSPSRPALSSSDSEDEAEETATRTKPPTPHDFSPETIPFHPIPNQNVIPLLPSQMTELGLDPVPGSLFCLRPGEEVAIGGVYRFCVLRGSISMLGTTFQPNQSVHKVCAPRSFPVPFILAQPSPISQFHLPPSLPTPATINNLILVVIYVLKTGLQGMGRICGLFEGLFSSSHGTYDFGVPGVYMVRL